METDEFRLTSLGQEVDLLTGFPFKSSMYTDDDDGIRLLRGDNIVQGKLRWDGVKRWPTSTEDGFSDYFLQFGDVVLAMDRPWIEAGLKYACLSQHDLPCLLVQRVARLRPKPTLDRRFLRYLIGSPGFTSHILAVQTGTAVPHISGGQIREFKFLCPPLPVQQGIGAFLGALDDKIELNRRMNETLEAMARALFKSWFVDFDPVRAKAESRQPVGVDAQTSVLFPDSLENSILGAIPKGWKVGKVGDLMTLSREAVNPGDFPTEVFDHYSIPAFDDGRLPKAESGEQIKSNKFIVRRESVLLSKLNPRIPRVWLPAVEGKRRAVSSTEFLGAAPQPNCTREYLYSLMLSRPFLDVFATLVTGTSGSHQRVKPEYLLEMNVIMPREEVLLRFGELVKPWLTQIGKNLQQSATLMAIRDALLPKLMSGEIRVKDAEQLVKAR